MDCRELSYNRKNHAHRSWNAVCVQRLKWVIGHPSASFVQRTLALENRDETRVFHVPGGLGRVDSFTVGVQVLPE
jgi:hypothetical protein